MTSTLKGGGRGGGGAVDKNEMLSDVAGGSECSGSPILIFL